MSSRAQTQCIAAAGGLHHRYACKRSGRLVPGFISYGGENFIFHPRNFNIKIRPGNEASVPAAAMHWHWARD